MGWLPEGLAAAVAEFRRLTEPHPWAHAVWLMPLVLFGAWLVGKFFEWVRCAEPETFRIMAGFTMDACELGRLTVPHTVPLIWCMIAATAAGGS